jgi:hypothetical protein
MSARAGSINIFHCRSCGRGLPLNEIDYRTGGLAGYVHVAETDGRLGFITPLTHNFCESCNRVRVTCMGTLYMCLGQEDAADLRTPLRASEGNDPLTAAIGRRFHFVACMLAGSPSFQRISTDRHGRWIDYSIALVERLSAFFIMFIGFERVRPRLTPRTWATFTCGFFSAIVLAHSLLDR